MDEPIDLSDSSVMDLGSDGSSDDDSSVMNLISDEEEEQEEEPFYSLVWNDEQFLMFLRMSNQILFQHFSVQLLAQLHYEFVYLVFNRLTNVIEYDLTVRPRHIRNPNAQGNVARIALIVQMFIERRLSHLTNVGNNNVVKNIIASYNMMHTNLIKQVERYSVSQTFWDVQPFQITPPVRVLRTEGPLRLNSNIPDLKWDTLVFEFYKSTVDELIEELQQPQANIKHVFNKYLYSFYNPLVNDVEFILNGRPRNLPSQFKDQLQSIRQGMGNMYEQFLRLPVDGISLLRTQLRTLQSLVLVMAQNIDFLLEKIDRPALMWEVRPYLVHTAVVQINAPGGQAISRRPSRSRKRAASIHLLFI